MRIGAAHGSVVWTRFGAGGWECLIAIAPADPARGRVGQGHSAAELQVLEADAGQPTGRDHARHQEDALQGGWSPRMLHMALTDTLMHHLVFCLWSPRMLHIVLTDTLMHHPVYCQGTLLPSLLRPSNHPSLTCPTPLHVAEAIQVRGAPGVCWRRHSKGRQTLEGDCSHAGGAGL